MSHDTIDWDTLQRTIDQLTPAEKVQLIEEVARSLRAHGNGPSPEARRVALDRLRRELADLPVQNPADGFSNRDHDNVLYGGVR